MTECFCKRCEKPRERSRLERLRLVHKYIAWLIDRELERLTKQENEW